MPTRGRDETRWCNRSTRVSLAGRGLSSLLRHNTQLTPCRVSVKFRIFRVAARGLIHISITHLTKRLTTGSACGTNPCTTMLETLHVLGKLSALANLVVLAVLSPL